MKGCLKFVLIMIAIFVGGGILLAALGIGAGAWSYSQMTPEQKAELAKATTETQRQENAKEQADQAFKKEAKRLHEAIIADEKPGFIQWLLGDGQCTRARFTADHEIDVELPRLLIPTKDDARVLAEQMAERWAIRGGGSRVVVTVYYGNEPYSEGVYSGGMHPMFTLKANALGALIDEKKAEAAAKTAQPTTQP